MRGAAARPSLPRVTPYRDYLALIARQDRAAALAAWRESLAGLEEGTRLAPRRAQRGRRRGGAGADRAVAWRGLRRRSIGSARERALTLNTVHADGLGHAARPADRARRRGVRGDGGGAAGGACRRRADGGAVHQHAAAADAAAAAIAVVGAAAADAGAPVAADGAPASRALPRSSRRRVWASCSTRSWCSRTIRSTAKAWRPPASGLRLGRVEGRDATHYPLALIVQPGETLQLRLDYRPDLFDAATSRRWAGG